MQTQGDVMETAGNRRISLPPDLYKKLEEIGWKEGKPISTVIQEALSVAKRGRLKSRFLNTQQYWTRKAKQKGILTERDLQRYLAR
ncbi:MAG TPA: hypothetical protein DD706_21890 [Nitrospiraceae bacterium]|nr:hypothetical protein [Nitrospiraceae bacterium]